MSPYFIASGTIEIYCANGGRATLNISQEPTEKPTVISEFQNVTIASSGQCEENGILSNQSFKLELDKYSNWITIGSIQELRINDKFSITNIDFCAKPNETGINRYAIASLLFNGQESNFNISQPTTGVGYLDVVLVGPNNFNAASHKVDFLIRTDLDWTISTDNSDLIEINERSRTGSGFKLVRANILRNATGKERSGLISVVGENDSLEIIRNIHINQSESKSLNFTPVQSYFKVYPNPALNFIIVEFDLLQGGPITIELYNSNGLKVQSFLGMTFPGGKHQERLDLEFLPSGLYTVLFTTPANRIVEKVIIY